MSHRSLLLGSGTLAMVGMALGVALWSARWPTLAIDALLLICG